MILCKYPIAFLAQLSENRQMKSQKGNVIVLVILVAIAVVSISAAIFFYLQSKPTQQTPTPTPVVTPFAFVPTETTPKVDSGEQAMVSTAVITFETDAIFSTQVKTDITSKIINPFLDYYSDQYNAGYVKTLTISKNSQKGSESYPYKASYEFEQNVTGGFLIGSGAKGVTWWTPECLNGCNFSAAFTSKYPEVVKLTQ